MQEHGKRLLQMKMQDLLMTNRIHSSKKDDSVLPDDDMASAAEPRTGVGASPNSPTMETEEGEGPPKQGDGISPVADNLNYELMLAGTGQPLLRIPAVGLMFADTLYGAPSLLPELVNRWGAIHRILVIVTVRQVLHPSD